MIRSPRLHSCTGVSLRSPNKGRLLLGSRPAPMAYSQRQRKLPSSHAHKTLHALRYNGRHLCTGGLYTPKFSRAADTNPMNWIGPRHLVGDEHWALPSAWLASFSGNKHARPTVCRDAVPPLSHRQVASSAERRSATFETEDRLVRPTATMCHATSVPWLNMQKRGSTVTLGLTVSGWRSNLPKKLARLPLNNLQPTNTPSHSNFVVAAIAEQLHRILASAHQCTAAAAFEGAGRSLAFGLVGLIQPSLRPPVGFKGTCQGAALASPTGLSVGGVRSARVATLEVKPPFRCSRVPLLAGSARSNLSPRCFFQKKAQFL